MALNVSTLSNYVEEKRLPLIAKSFLRGKTIDLIQLETGVLQDTALNLVSAQVEFGDGASCGWNPTEGVALSQRILKPTFLKVNQTFCDKDLLKKWASYEVKLAAGREQLPFEEKFMEEIANAINESIEKLVWQGDSSHTNEPDGFLKILEAGGSGVVSVTWNAGTTAYNKIKAVYNAIPANIIDKEDTVIFVGEETYREFIQDLVAANLYHFSPDYKAGEYMVPGTSIRVIAVNGLNGTGKIVAGRLSNFFYGVGAEDDKDTFDFWYSQDNREFRLAAYFAIAVQVAYPNEIVLGKKAA
ncbi:MAG: hypothetical protein Q4E87_02100 [bacterium]|nr:hypothetical protein [bacterium]